MTSRMIDQSSDPAADQSDHTAHLWINELLLGMRLSGLHYRRIELTPPFGTRFTNSADRAQFHFIAQGSLVLRMHDGSTHALASGDAVLLPRGGVHELLSSPNVPSECIDEMGAVSICDGVSCVNSCRDDTPHTDAVRVFSGCMAFDLGGMRPLISLMPAVMPVHTLLSSYPELLPMLEAMARESDLKRVGSAGILARLADVVAASIVRGWVECGCGEIDGWVAAWRDPRLGRVLVAVHRDPGLNWTVASMAAVADLSRSVFAERFTRLLGTAPLAYVTALRMRLARQWIDEKNWSIDTVAWALGYSSQAAFSRAFKRTTGTTPAANRGNLVPAIRESA